MADKVLYTLELQAQTMQGLMDHTLLSAEETLTLLKKQKSLEWKISRNNAQLEDFRQLIAHSTQVFLLLKSRLENRDKSLKKYKKSISQTVENVWAKTLWKFRRPELYLQFLQFSVEHLAHRKTEKILAEAVRHFPAIDTFWVFGAQFELQRRGWKQGRVWLLRGLRICDNAAVWKSFLRFELLYLAQALPVDAVLEQEGEAKAPGNDPSIIKTILKSALEKHHNVEFCHALLELFSEFNAQDLKEIVFDSLKDLQGDDIEMKIVGVDSENPLFPELISVVCGEYRVMIERATETKAESAKKYFDFLANSILISTDAPMQSTLYTLTTDLDLLVAEDYIKYYQQLLNTDILATGILKFPDSVELYLILLEVEPSLKMFEAASKTNNGQILGMFLSYLKAQNMNTEIQNILDVASGFEVDMFSVGYLQSGLQAWTNTMLAREIPPSSLVLVAVVEKCLCTCAVLLSRGSLTKIFERLHLSANLEACEIWLLECRAWLYFWPADVGKVYSRAVAALGAESSFVRLYQEL